MMDSLVRFTTTTISLIAFVIMGVLSGASDATVIDEGIYVAAPVNWGITLGTFAIGKDVGIHHEVGHMRQYEILGDAYWFVVAVPSLVSAILEPANHEHLQVEIWADELGGN